MPKRTDKTDKPEKPDKPAKTLKQSSIKNMLMKKAVMHKKHHDLLDGDILPDDDDIDDTSMASLVSSVQLSL